MTGGIDLGAAAVHLAAQLVAIDSVNPSLVPGSAGEYGVLRHLRARLDANGFTTHVIEAPGHSDRPSLVAVPPPGGPASRPTVVLNGHLDTVGAGAMTAPFEPRVVGDRLLGRGAADMKAGIACLVVTAEHLVRTGAPVRPVLALVADEEDASLGSEAVIGALPGLGFAPDVCVIGEPTDLALARSLRGFVLACVRLLGRAAHSSQPDLGVNAVTHLGRLVVAVEEQAAPIRRRDGDLMVTAASGGGPPFVVPDHAECLVERRTVPGESADSAVDEIRALVANLAVDGLRAEVEVLAHREAWRLDGHGPAAALAATLGAALGTSATFDAPYWMEAPLWQAVCPTLVCGPSGGGLHADDEWVDLRQVRSYATALPQALTQWCEWAQAHDAD